MREIKHDNVEHDDIEEAFDDLKCPVITFVFDDIGEVYMKLRIPNARGASEKIYHLHDLDEGTLDARLEALLSELVEERRS